MDHKHEPVTRENSLALKTAEARLAVDIEMTVNTRTFYERSEVGFFICKHCGSVYCPPDTLKELGS